MQYALKTLCAKAICFLFPIMFHLGYPIEEVFMETIDFKNTYVNRDLLKRWSADGERVNWYNPVDKTGTENTEIEELYYFFFHDMRPVVLAMVDNNDDNFLASLEDIEYGENVFKRESLNLKARTSFMFQYLRTPSFFKEDYSRCMGPKTLSFLNRFKGRSYFTVVEKDFEVLKGHLETMANCTLSSTLEMFDLEGIILSVPEGKSFVVGATPVIMMNPYFEKRYASTKMDDKPYDIMGAVMILPVSPKTAVMLYDSLIYDVDCEDGKAVLSEEDVDKINTAEIYNSDIDGGVVYSGLDTSYLDSLKDKISDTPFRAGYAWFTAARYPISMLLSIMKIKDEEQKNISKNAKKPLRDYVVSMREHDKMLERRRYNDFGDKMVDKLNYASSLLGIDGQFKSMPGYEV